MHASAKHEAGLSRSRLLQLGLALPSVVAVVGETRLVLDVGAATAAPLAATPAVADDDEPTPEVTEGPYFTPNSPLRSGHQLTDARGRYTLLTVVPGLYPGRTKHIHVKVQAPGEPVLTTQLFFPGVARNGTDAIFDAELLVKGWRLVRGRRVARFDFVLNVS